MNLVNVYVVNGLINENGLYEDKSDVNTYIAECKNGINEGYSYFAFLNYNTVFKTSVNTNMVRLRELMSLINNPKIKVTKLTDEELEKYKERFLLILENNEGFNSKKLSI